MVDGPPVSRHVVSPGKVGGPFGGDLAAPAIDDDDVHVAGLAVAVGARADFVQQASGRI